MKKIFFVMAFLMAAVTVHAGEIVGIVYPFSASESPNNYARNMIQQANGAQNKYTFVLENRPGAAGSIGTQWTETRDNSIVMTSSAFYLRPIFYPKESHNPANFVPLMTQCNLPMLVLSGKYKNWNEVPKDSSLNISISGLGATSHLVGLQIQKKFPNLQVIPYKGTADALTDISNGLLDFGVGFVSETLPWVKSGKLNALGTTGTQSVEGIPTLKSHGFDNADSIQLGMALYVPKTISNEKYNEWREILMEASKSKSVLDSYQADSCVPNVLDRQQTFNWYQTQLKQWKMLTDGIAIK